MQGATISRMPDRNRLSHSNLITYDDKIARHFGVKHSHFDRLLRCTLVRDHNWNSRIPLDLFLCAELFRHHLHPRISNRNVNIISIRHQKRSTIVPIKRIILSMALFLGQLLRWTSNCRDRWIFKRPRRTIHCSSTKMCRTVSKGSKRLTDGRDRISIRGSNSRVNDQDQISILGSKTTDQDRNSILGSKSTDLDRNSILGNKSTDQDRMWILGSRWRSKNVRSNVQASVHHRLMIVSHLPSSNHYRDSTGTTIEYVLLSTTHGRTFKNSRNVSSKLSGKVHLRLLLVLFLPHDQQ